MRHDSISVWRVGADAAAEAAQLAPNVLSADERARAAQMVSPSRRAQFVAGRVLLRLLLGRCIDTDPSELILCRGPYGKPMLDAARHGDRLQFSVAHTYELFLYAVCRERPVGIDAEWEHAQCDAGRIVRRFFSERERAAWHALAPDAQARAFWRGWTRKEACAKATGNGLAVTVGHCEVALAPWETGALLHVASGTSAGSRWTLRDIDPLPGYIGAVAVGGQEPWRVECRTFPSVF